MTRLASVPPGYPALIAKGTRFEAVGGDMSSGKREDECGTVPPTSSPIRLIVTASLDSTPNQPARCVEATAAF